MRTAADNRQPTTGNWQPTTGNWQLATGNWQHPDTQVTSRLASGQSLTTLPAMRKASLAFLENLINTPSPSGFETRGQRVWLDYVGKHADATETDAYGNAVAWLNKGGSPRLMLAAHADEIAMTVNFINEKGFIYVRKMGGIDPAITKAQRVTIHTRGGPVKGVVGNVAPHLMKLEGEPKPPKIHELFIDIGVSKRSAAEKLVRIGDPITLVDEFDILRGDLAVARAFDNRIGTFAVVEALRLLARSGRPRLFRDTRARPRGYAMTRRQSRRLPRQRATNDFRLFHHIMITLWQSHRLARQDAEIIVNHRKQFKAERKYAARCMQLPQRLRRPRR